MSDFSDELITFDHPKKIATLLDGFVAAETAGCEGLTVRESSPTIPFRPPHPMTTLFMCQNLKKVSKSVKKCQKVSKMSKK
jgi:hypothetical protein